MLSLVIQAGGESRRMGHNKALTSFHGQPLIQWVLHRLRPIADEILIIGNNPVAYEFLHVPVFPDLIPNRGALGGLYTALSAAAYPLVAVVACDMPFASAELLAYQRDVLVAADADLAVPKTAVGLEPFHAVYRKAACLPLVQSAIATGQWRVSAWFGEAKARFILPAEVARFDPQGLAFLNINTPDDLKLAESVESRKSKVKVRR